MALDKYGKPLSVPKPAPKGGKRPKDVGKRTESAIAKRVEGTRVPMSGAVKNSVHNLAGDVTVNDDKGTPFLLFEIKASGVINTKGDKVYTLAKSVLQQMYTEAKTQQQLGAFRLHFLNDSYEEDWVIMRGDDFERILKLAKQGNTLGK